MKRRVADGVFQRELGKVKASEKEFCEDGLGADFLRFLLREIGSHPYMTK